MDSQLLVGCWESSRVAPWGGEVSPAILENQNRQREDLFCLPRQLNQQFQGSGALNSTSSHAILDQSFSTIGFSILWHYLEFFHSGFLLILPSKKCVWIFTTVPNKFSVSLCTTLCTHTFLSSLHHPLTTDHIRLASCLP